MSEPRIEGGGQPDESAIVDEGVNPEYAGTDLRRKRGGTRHQPVPKDKVVDDVERGAVEEIEEQTDVQPNRQDG